jgi:hypothetical protein
VRIGARRGTAALVAAVALCAAFALAPATASAHGRSLSYSSWRIVGDGAWVRVRVPLLELTRLGLDPTDPGSTRSIADELAEGVRLTSAGQPCEPTVDPLAVPAPEGWAAYEWRLRCPTQGPLAVTSTLLLDQAPSHLHFARVEDATGAVRERVLTDAAPTWWLGDPNAPSQGSGGDGAGTTLAGYVALGIEHIATGFDHLAFVLALLLLAGTLGEVASLVTGFTIAHSVTLALAVLGFVRPDPAPVEALIGFSIALVAAENGWLLGGRGRAVPWFVTTALLLLAGLALAGIGAVPAGALAGLALFSFCHFGLLERVDRPARLRAAVAFAFGLVHGFGFAGVLAEMDLPRDRLAAALFGFNVGVELGQLAIVAVAWPALRLLAGASGRAYRALAEIGSAAICGLGLFWFVTRTFG